MPPAVRTTRRTGSGRGGFRGWPPDAVEFFERLEVDNTKTFWSAHKDIYEGAVLAPMLALLDDLAPEFGEGRVFRPYRDTRFSADKSPYKTNIAARNDAGYISLSARALGVGAGLYMPSPGQLAQFRAAVDHDRSGRELVDIVAALEKKGIGVSAHEVLKKAPRGVAPDHPRIELLRHKGMTAWRDWPVGAWLGTTAARNRVIAFLRDAAPLRGWLQRHVDAGEH